MAEEIIPIDVSAMPELRRLAEDVARTRRPKALRVDSEDVALIVPKTSRRSRIPRGRPTSADDPFWKLVGIGRSGKHDIAVNHDRYLADAKTSTSE
ncbi:MAG TPA: hypothetical protein VK821_01010 [Dehalococcoidia bacterium]|nr:hypothetical protein [Dehalococcoidia bacterium]